MYCYIVGINQLYIYFSLGISQFNIHFFSILTVLTSEVLKHTTKRHRPEVGVIKKRRIPIRKNYVNFSFPSGDSAQVYIFLYFTFE